MTILKTTLLIALLTLGSIPATAVVVATDWLSTTTTTAHGDLSGVTVDVTGVGVTSAPPLLWNYDLSGADYAPNQLAVSQETLDYSFDQNWTATFGSSITNLLLYCKFWRGPNNGGADPATFEYEFDQPFTILSGFTNSSVVGNTLIVPSTIFQDGILQFSGPVLSVSVISNNANSASRQGLTFAVTEDSVADQGETWGGVKSLYR